MGEFDHLSLDQLVSITAKDKPAEIAREALGWQGMAWLFEAQLARLTSAVSALQSQWSSPAGAKFVEEVGKIRETLNEGSRKASGNHKAWQVIGEQARETQKKLTELKAKRDKHLQTEQAQFEAAKKEDAENYNWGWLGISDLTDDPEAPDLGAIRSDYDRQARAVMTQADSVYTEQYYKNLWWPPPYEGPLDAKVPQEYKGGGGGSTYSGGGGGGVPVPGPRGGGSSGSPPPNGGPPGGSPPPTFGPPVLVEGPILTGPPPIPLPPPLTQPPPVVTVPPLPPVVTVPPLPPVVPVPIPPVIPPVTSLPGGPLPGRGTPPGGRPPLLPPRTPTTQPVIGGRPAPGAPTPGRVPPPAGGRPTPGTPTPGRTQPVVGGRPTPGAPTPGRVPPPAGGRPTPGTPTPGRTAPVVGGRPTPGAPTPGRTAPTPGRTAPVAGGRPTPGAPTSGRVPPTAGGRPAPGVPSSGRQNAAGSAPGGRVAPAGTAAGTTAGGRPAGVKATGVVGPRVGGPAQQHGAGIIGSSRRARRRDERDPQVAETEHDLWQVDDDLPAVIEAPAPEDLRDEPPGPYIGGGRRT